MTFDDLPLPNTARERLALQDAALTFNFVMMHELGHLCNGHLEWIARNQRFAFIAEVASQRATPSNGMERETSKWDADSFALGNILAWATEPRLTTVEGRGVWDIPASNTIATVENGVHCVLAALFICANFFSVGDPSDLRDPAPRSHPRPAARLYSAYSSVLHRCPIVPAVRKKTFLILSNVLDRSPRPGSWRLE